MNAIDVSRAECSRTYVFADGFEITIDSPKTVYITDSGSHRVSNGHEVTYVGKDWRAIRWVPMAGSPEVIV